jgi:hypothetical protein
MWACGSKPFKLQTNAPARILACALTAFGVMPQVRAQAPASPPSASVSTAPSPAELQAELPGSQLSGTAKLTFWGLDIYNASLWVTAEFQPSRYTQHPFALQLTYLRNLEGAAIAKRSIEEMLRQARFTPDRAQAWQAAMAAIFPDVKSGDRITGIHKPGTGARFLVNGKAQGDIADAEFARLFFGIWLSDATSEPGMRRSLLAQKSP